MTDDDFLEEASRLSRQGKRSKDKSNSEEKLKRNSQKSSDKDISFLEKASKMSREGKSPKSLYGEPPKKTKKRSKTVSFIGRTAKYAAYSIFAVAGIGAAGVVGAFYLFSSDLPDHSSLKKYSPSLSSRVFLQDGSKLCEYSTERRYFVPIDLIPLKLINAFIAAEDKNFFTHQGVDFWRIAGSLINNIKHLGSGKRPQGASTITQQVARIFLIKQNNVSYIRKIKEAILAYRIEHTLSKRQILELYLNQIYLGLGSYGVAAAAKTYFNKSLNELTIGECAYLAGLPKGANNYHPIKHRDKAITRRNWALFRLLDNNYITKMQYQDAIKEDLTMAPQASDEYSAEYFSEEVRKHIMSNYTFANLNQEGLVVRTTLNPKFQKCAYDALQRGLENIDRSRGWRGPLTNIDLANSHGEIVKILQATAKPKGADNFQRAVLLSKVGKILVEDGATGSLTDNDLNWAKRIKAGDVILVEKRKDKYVIKQLPNVQGAIVVIDVHNGHILAMQGGYSFAQSEFNRATQAKRQLGSVFKPFVYLSALDSGFAPNSIIDASPCEIDLGYGMGTWQPKNYGNAILDQITFRQALERSVNTATVRIAKEVGMKKIALAARQFGIFENMPHYFSYAIGSGETSLLNITTAYAMLANGGKKITPTMIDYIADKNGKTIYKADERKVYSDVTSELPPRLVDPREQIWDEQSIYQTTSLLEGVMQRGSGASAKSLNILMAGKTGTSNDSRDTWFIGYTPDIAVGVFVGYDDHTKSLGQRATGSSIALPIFIKFMSAAKKYLQPKPFKVPKGIRLKTIDAKTGSAPRPGEPTIVEAFKKDEEVNANILQNPLANPLKGDEESEQKNPSENQEAKQVFGIY